MEVIPKAKGGGDQKSNHRGIGKPSDLPTLEDCGIDKNLAHAARTAKRHKVTSQQTEQQKHQSAHQLESGASSGPTPLESANKECVSAQASGRGRDGHRRWNRQVAMALWRSSFKHGSKTPTRVSKLVTRRLGASFLVVRLVDQLRGQGNRHFAGFNRSD